MVAIKKFVVSIVFILTASAAFAQLDESPNRDSVASHYLLKTADLYYSTGKRLEARTMYLDNLNFLNDEQKLKLINVIVDAPRNREEKKLSVQLLNSLPQSYDNKAMPFRGRIYYYGYDGTKDTIKGLELIAKSMKDNNPDAYFFKAWILTDAKNFKAAFECFKKAADMNHPIASNNLAWFYRDGKGVDKNYDSAFYWYNKAAGLGYGLAYANLGWLYYNGQGVNQDFNKAMENFSMAHQFGDDSYSYVIGLGNCYLNGYGIRKNVDSALKFYRIAADMGNAVGYTQIGSIYEQYKGNDKKFTDSVMYYYLYGAKIGDANAFNEIGYAFLNGTIVKKDDKIAADFFKEGMKHGNQDCAISYANMLRKGQGVKQDIPKATQLSKEASAKGNYRADVLLAMILMDHGKTKEGVAYIEKLPAPEIPEVTYNLGCMYWYGNEIKQNKALGLEWIEQGASTGYAPAQTFLGNLYLVGYDGFQKDSSKAFYWLQKAAMQGNAGALNDLGECYYTGFGVKQDFEKARYYYQLSADKDEPIGKVSLGVLYMNGEGVTKDMDKARKLFDEACKDGSPEGCEKLKSMN